MSDRDLLLRLLGEGYERKAWHGPNLRGTLRGINANQAFWRPAPDRHNIWDLVLHCAYWKFVAWRRITGSRGVRFPPAGSKFFPPPMPAEGGGRGGFPLPGEGAHPLRGAGGKTTAPPPGSKPRKHF